MSIELEKGIWIELVEVEGGHFLMGSEESVYDDDVPVHGVEVPSFRLGKYPVTQAVWEAVMGNNPSDFKGTNRPVENVSWEDVQQFLVSLSDKTGKDFRLPSESEWEYAARGGRYSQDYIYAGSDKLSQVGWYVDNSNDETHEVGLLLPNELGLYDMSGNVREWCADDWHDNYKGAPTDGSAWIDAPDRGARRVLRGGSYFYSAEPCRPTIRYRFAPGNRGDNIGVRLAMSLQLTGNWMASTEQAIDLLPWHCHGTKR